LGLFFQSPSYKIIQNGSSRNWSDGTYAKNCNEYLNPPASTRKYQYVGATGNGAYTILPQGAASPFTVYCSFLNGGNVYDTGGFTFANQSDYNTGYYRDYTPQQYGENLPQVCVQGTKISTFYAGFAVNCNGRSYDPSRLTCLYNGSYGQGTNVTYYYYGDSLGCGNWGDLCYGTLKYLDIYYRCK
jgi:hypothetical protein